MFGSAVMLFWLYQSSVADRPAAPAVPRMGSSRASATLSLPSMGLDAAPKSRNIFKDDQHGSKGLRAEERYSRLGMRGATLWFTGFSGSGKSTIGKRLEEVLVKEYSKHTYRLDGDNVRFGLNSDLGFKKQDRAENVRRVGEVAALFAESGTIVVASLISPYRSDRDRVRAMHEKKGLPFLEVFVDVPIAAAEARDPKGLYKKARAGKIKGFTGLDAPYEAPKAPELRLRSDSMSVDEEVNAIIFELRRRGILTAAEAPLPQWHPALGAPDGGLGWKAPSLSRVSKATAATFPQVLLSDIDLQWAQVIGEGWAAPLNGFMREGTLLQTLHFNSILLDERGMFGLSSFNNEKTNFNTFNPNLQKLARVGMSVPIILPITAATKRLIGSARKVTLVSPSGEAVAVLSDPEIYEFRKEEVISRVWGGYDPDHPYQKHLMAAGPFLLGGEVELLRRIRYHDGLDKYRLTPAELRQRFIDSGADAVYAFQTRNPTHAGHAYLMQDAGRQLKKMGFKKPVLWLTPLGGWTKDDDMPLDVRIRQHEVVIESGMLPADTVMAIWPSPMMYAGPTEVQWHAKSRRNVGARFFITGRDPAGIKRSKNKHQMVVGGDFYDGNHGRYVLQTSPGLGEMRILSFPKVYYDTTDNTMKPKDPKRKSDFISISGSTMRALARKGAPPCSATVPTNWEQTKPCIPSGFMVEKGWNMMVNYYQNPKSDKWIAYSRETGKPLIAPGNFNTKGTFGTPGWTLHFSNDKGDTISPWHDIALYPDGHASSAARVVNMVVEIPMGRMEKLEVNKETPGNPIKQDTKKGKPRYYKYGIPFFNYGMLPRTWEDPAHTDAAGRKGDGDPLDVIEVGSKQLPTGTVAAVKVIGVVGLIDQGEVDHKIIVIRKDDPLAATVRKASDLEPEVTSRILDWLKMYKTAEGKAVNELTTDTIEGPLKAMAVIRETHDYWSAGAFASKAAAAA